MNKKHILYIILIIALAVFIIRSVMKKILKPCMVKKSIKRREENVSGLYDKYYKPNSKIVKIQAKIHKELYGGQ